MLARKGINHLKVLETLLIYGAKVNAKALGDITPLHMAAQLGQNDAIQHLHKASSLSALRRGRACPEMGSLGCMHGQLAP